MLGFGLCGLLGSAGFIAVKPNQYEAIAQIQMAQISPPSNNVINSHFINAEDPIALMTRLRLPSAYSELEVDACGLENEIKARESLVGISKISVVKGVSSIIELKVVRGSKEQASFCAQAIFENILNSQNEILKLYDREATELSKNHQTRLREAQELIGLINNNESSSYVAYLAGVHLSTFRTYSKPRKTKLVSPIYASEVPISPNKKVILIAGLLVGLFLGLCLVTVRKIWPSY